MHTQERILTAQIIVSETFKKSTWNREELQKWRWVWEELKGGIRDEYDQNTLHNTLKEVIKIYKINKNKCLIVSIFLLMIISIKIVRGEKFTIKFGAWKVEQIMPIFL